MKPAVPLLIALTFAPLTPWAQESANPVAGPGTNTVVSREDLARYRALTRRELELNTRIKLLSDLSAEHRLLADSAREHAKPDLENWETALARDLSERGARELQQLNAVSKERLAMEETRQVVGAEPLAANDLERTNSVTADEAAFLAKLRERTWDLEQDLAAALEVGRIHASQLQTNTLPEEVGRVSLALEENAMRIRVLQKQMSDLELMKLQFQALRSRR